MTFGVGRNGDISRKTNPYLSFEFLNDREYYGSWCRDIMYKLDIWAVAEVTMFEMLAIANRTAKARDI